MNLRLLSNYLGRFLDNGTRRCLLCHGKGYPLCSLCAQDWPHLPLARCPLCALPMAGGVMCGRCQRRPPPFAATHAVAAYTWPLDSLIHACKYREQLWLFDGLATLLDDAVPPAMSVDALLPMPLDSARLAERGYNQAYELARRLACRRGLPMLTHHVRRRNNSAHQVDLPLRQRIRNMRGAFSVQHSLPARIAIVDDVMTSGASVTELAKTLQSAGVEHVEVWVLARTLPRVRP